MVIQTNTELLLFTNYRHRPPFFQQEVKIFKRYFEDVTKVNFINTISFKT